MWAWRASFIISFKNLGLSDIPDANAEIPEDPEVALRQNAMKIIREDAVNQAKKMISLVESISATTIKNSVVGEIFKTNSKGVKMIIQKYVKIPEKLMWILKSCYFLRSKYLSKVLGFDKITTLALL